jgi:hypothetical protein
VKSGVREVLCFLVLSAIFYASDNPVLAQSDSTGEYTLGEVVVTAAREGVKAIQTQ